MFLYNIAASSIGMSFDNRTRVRDIEIECKTDDLTMSICNMKL